jgi:hypothetical protein
VLFPPSAEQRFWARLLPVLFAPRDGRGTWLTRAWGVFTTAPFANVTLFSLPYQAYLYDVFHQSRVTRAVHAVTVPLVNLLLMVALGVAFPAAAFPAEAPGFFALDGALAYAALLLVWFVAWAAVERSPLWGAVMAAVVLGLLAGARAWAAAPPPLDPLVGLGALGLLQTLAHTAEPRLPPRVSMSPRWMTVAEFLLGPAHAPHPPLTRGVRLVRATAQVPYGALNELWASPHLLPLTVLAWMWRRGYQPARFQALDALTQQALADGNPALDFIGTGGDAFLPGSAPHARA